MLVKGLVQVLVLVLIHVLVQVPIQVLVQVLVQGLGLVQSVQVPGELVCLEQGDVVGAPVGGPRQEEL